MVEHQDEQVEWQNLLKVRYRLSDRLKCIPGGVGCLLLQPEDRGFMVTPGTHDAHQLSRATCSNPCNQNVCQIQDSNIHPAKNRKYHNSSLYKQSWGYSLQEACAAHTRSMDVVPGKEHPHHSSTPTMDNECNSRYRITGNMRQVELNDISADHYGPLEVDLFASRLST